MLRRDGVPLAAICIGLYARSRFTLTNQAKAHPQGSEAGLRAPLVSVCGAKRTTMQFDCHGLTNPINAKDCIADARTNGLSYLA